MSQPAFLQENMVEDIRIYSYNCVLDTGWNQSEEVHEFGLELLVNVGVKRH